MLINKIQLMLCFISRTLNIISFFYISPSIDCYSISVGQIDNLKVYMMMDKEMGITGTAVITVIQNIYPALLW